MPMLDVHLVRYTAVGAANTLIGLSVIFAAKALLGLDDLAANLLGYAVGIAFGFVVNRAWTFGHTGDAGGALLRYCAVLMVAYSANLLTVLFAIDTLGMDGYAAQVLGVVPYFVVGYVGSRTLAFAPPRR